MRSPITVGMLVLAACSGGSNDVRDLTPVGTCLAWEPAEHDPFHQPNRCTCWEPLYCWCLMPGQLITRACAPGGAPCCDFPTTCLPCGWTQAPADAAVGPTETCATATAAVGKVEGVAFRKCTKWAEAPDDGTADPGDAADVPDPAPTDPGTSDPGCVPACADRNCGADGCGGVCGTCTDPQVCVTLTGTCSDATVPAMSFGPAGQWSSLQIVADATAGKESCVDFTGDGAGDNSLAAVAGTWNAPLAGAVDGAALLTVLEFLGADDFAGEAEFRLVALRARPKVPGDPATLVVLRDSFGPDNRPWTDLPASIVAGALTAGPSPFRLTIPFGDFPLTVPLADARVRGPVDGDSSVFAGVSVQGGILGGILTVDAANQALADLQGRCDASQAGAKPGYCDAVTQLVLHGGDVKTAWFTLHDEGEGASPRYVPRSKDKPGDSAAVCLRFDLAKAANLEIEPVLLACQSHPDCPWDQRCTGGFCRDAPDTPVPPILDACARALPEPDCVAAGGAWSCDPCPGVTDCACACPADDAGRPCWMHEHCQGDCTFPGEQDQDLEACRGIGQCSASRLVWPSGCRCELYDPIGVMCSC